MKPTENRQRQQKRGFLSTSQKACRQELYQDGPLNTKNGLDVNENIWELDTY